MKALKSYKFIIKNPGLKIIDRFDSTLNLCRELYNAGLQERRDAWNLNQININYFDQQKQLPEIKEVRPELKEVYSQILQDVLGRLDKTFKSFFNRVKRKEKAGFPRFKNGSRYNSFTFPQSGFFLTGNKLTLSKIGTVKLKLTRQIIGKIKTLTVKREIDKWFAIFQVETKPEILPKSGQNVGIDVGIKSFATLSDGIEIENFKYFEQSQKQLRRVQRSMARKKKGSTNRRKTVLKLRKLHQKIKNRRTDFQHKISTWLIKTFDVICIEKLNILGMKKGMLSKQIHDASWSSFFDMLRYKAEGAGKEVREVKPNGTSQICSGCSQIVKKALKERTHSCPDCGLVLNRDHNAAINILRLGTDLLDITCEVTQSVSEESAVF